MDQNQLGGQHGGGAPLAQYQLGGQQGGGALFKIPAGETGKNVIIVSALLFKLGSGESNREGYFGVDTSPGCCSWLCLRCA